MSSPSTAVREPEPRHVSQARIDDARRIRAGALTYAELADFPPLVPTRPFRIYQEAGRVLPRTALLVEGVVKRAVQQGGTSALVSFDELALLTGSCERSCRRAVALLLDLDRLVKVPGYVDADAAGELWRARNCYRLGESVTPPRVVKPRDAAWRLRNRDKRPDRVSDKMSGPTLPGSGTARRPETARAADQQLGDLVIVGGGRGSVSAAAAEQSILPAAEAEAPRELVAAAEDTEDASAWVERATRVVFGLDRLSRTQARPAHQHPPKLPERLLAALAEQQRIEAALDAPELVDVACVTLVDGVAQPARADGSPHTNPAAVSQGSTPRGRQ